MDAIKTIAGSMEATAAVFPNTEQAYQIQTARQLDTHKPVTSQEPLPDLGIKFDTEQLKQLLEKLNTVLAIYNTKLSFGMENNISWVRIINTENNETIKQIPPEEIVKTMMRLKEVAGVLINEEK
jgi:uncharacterized FlaG/YvyC family protein